MDIAFMDEETEILSISFNGTFVNFSKTCVINIINPTGKGSRLFDYDTGMILNTWLV